MRVLPQAGWAGRRQFGWLLSFFQAQAFVHDRAGCGVLQKHTFVRIKVFLHAKGGQRSFVKTTEYELFLTGVGVDIADCKDTRSRWSQIFQYPHGSGVCRYPVPIHLRARGWVTVPRIRRPRPR